MQYVEIEKAGSVVSGLGLGRRLAIDPNFQPASVGEVVAVRAITESVTYGNLELCSGRLAKINAGDTLLGALGRRRALKGFVGDVPQTIKAGDRLHLLNMGGVIGECTGHHSSLSDAIEVEVIGLVFDENGNTRNIADNALSPATALTDSAPLIVVAGTCMNSGKTVAATELIKQATKAGLRVAAGKLSGIACLRDTLNMADHGAIVTKSFVDCGLPSTVGLDDLAPYAKAIINELNAADPDLIVLELGDGIVGGYAADTVLRDAEIRTSISALVFCASDYVGVIGGSAVLKEIGLSIDVVAGSVTDSKMGEDYVESTLQLPAGNARRDGKRLFDLAFRVQDEVLLAA